jgi:protein O-GlcNAc transferase
MKEDIEPIRKTRSRGILQRTLGVIRRVRRPDTDTDSVTYQVKCGSALLKKRKVIEAKPFFDQALVLDPDNAEAHYGLGIVSTAQGHLDLAVKNYKRAIALKPDYAEAHINLGAVFQAQGKLDHASAQFEKTLSIQPELAFAHNNLAAVLQLKGDSDRAIRHYERAIEIEPGYADAHNNLGVLLQGRGSIDEAVASFERALALKSDGADIHYNLANGLRDQGDRSAAVTHYEKALAIKPNFPEAQNNLGNVLRLRGNLESAMTHCEKAIAMRPDYAIAHDNLAVILNDLDDFDAAMSHFRKALAIEPRSATTLNNMGAAFKDQGNLEEAIDCYRRALTIDPHAAEIYSNLLLTMVYAASVSPQKLASTARDFGKNVADRLLRNRPQIRDANPERKLRVGFVSPDFRDHSVSYFFAPLVTLHDRRQFEFFAYSNCPREDRVTERLREEFDHWRDIWSLTEDKVADLIEGDAIDILVDLAGHTANNRLLVFARKPAPVQVSWLGYPASTGMAAMDYRITDTNAEPPGMTEHLNAEKLWRLPNIFSCYQPHEKSPEVIDHAPTEDNGCITFGCFNNWGKLSDATLAAWATIIEGVPNSRLLLEIRGIESPEFRLAVEERLQRLGLPLDRTTLEPRKKSNQFVLYNRIDIALDPFPCVGGTTSMDSIWMGVPLITLAGDQFLSRIGVTILKNAGLAELIANNTDQYIAIAAGLALDLPRLKGLRRGLRDRVSKSPLMDQASFTRDMEAAFRGMWRQWCNEQAKVKTD